MKQYFVLVIAVMFLALPACEQKQTTTEKVMDRVDDALDRRPDEKARDIAEDIGDKVDDALDRRPDEKARDMVENISDQLKETTEEIQEEIEGATK